MEIKKKSFVVYNDWDEFMVDFTMEEYGEMFKMLLAHSKGKEFIPKSKMVIGYSRIFIAQMNRDAEKYIKLMQRRAESKNKTEKTDF